MRPVATIHRAFGTPLQNLPSVTPAGKSGHTPRFMGSCALDVGYRFLLFCLPRDVYFTYPTTGDRAVLSRPDNLRPTAQRAKKPVSLTPRFPGERSTNMKCLNNNSSGLAQSRRCINKAWIVSWLAATFAIGCVHTTQEPLRGPASELFGTDSGELMDNLQTLVVAGADLNEQIVLGPIALPIQDLPKTLDLILNHETDLYPDTGEHINYKVKVWACRPENGRQVQVRIRVDLGDQSFEENTSVSLDGLSRLISGYTGVIMLPRGESPRFVFIVGLCMECC